MQDPETTTAILVKTEAVMNARVTIGTSKYQASSGSLAPSSIILSVLPLECLRCSNDGCARWPLIWPRSTVRMSNFNFDFLAAYCINT
jgi:hypothetical protein